MTGRAHRVRQGECICTIAASAGMPWDKVWDAPQNEALRERERHPNLLLPGDQLHVPAPELEARGVATSRVHRVVIPGERARVHLTLVGGLEALADEPYVVEYEGGEAIEGSTDGEGKLVLDLPVRLAKAILKLPNRRLRYTLALSALDPVDTPTGAHGRLRNLGHAQADYQEARAGEALRRFQRDADLEPSGELDDDTIAALEQAHGS
ncbi:peptidoglycan-binding protein [Pseudenhygromyxa sp. WMMC2535]|uniref:peptidoglycan-binding domain-containing protein n=1 Tax=Pseudenhygromyxa sp. WMMC2535 TaxID=2712867 RepID=UPI0015953291|nr:peptidoglycan-binding domain-containing protein [Pseudenhygromyxa sp. WMMC2535]NVB39017.1 peptidoglycan-binding protein [Pseudenhygromyxa sp. WMMC2535]